MKLNNLLAVLACVSLSCSAFAANDTAAGTSKGGQAAGQKKMMDGMVLNLLHHINMHKVELANVAQDKAKSEQIKQAATQLKQEHQALEQRVEQLAKSNQIELVDFSPSTDEKYIMDQLRNLQGAAFDQAFIHTVHQRYRQNIDELQMISKGATDQRIQSLVKDTIPQLEQNERMSMTTYRGIASEPIGVEPEKKSK